MIDAIRQFIRYDPNTGKLYWIDGKCAESEAGSRTCNGYILIRVVGRQLLAHRLAWMLHYNEEPESDIDHINGFTTDNRINNLRLCTMSGNIANSRVRNKHNNSSLYKGVSLHKGREDKPWRSYIVKDGKQIHLGYFSAEIDAAKAYDKRAVSIFGEFAFTNFEAGLYR